MGFRQSWIEQSHDRRAGLISLARTQLEDGGEWVVILVDLEEALLSLGLVLLVFCPIYRHHWSTESLAILQRVLLWAYARGGLEGVCRRRPLWAGVDPGEPVTSQRTVDLIGPTAKSGGACPLESIDQSLDGFVVQLESRASFAGRLLQHLRPICCRRAEEEAPGISRRRLSSRRQRHFCDSQADALRSPSQTPTVELPDRLGRVLAGQLLQLPFPEKLSGRRAQPLLFGSRRVGRNERNGQARS